MSLFYEKGHSTENDECYKIFYSKDMMNKMSSEISDRLKNKIEKYPHITISKRNLLHVMDSIYYNPDIKKDVNALYMMTISYCVEMILNDLENEFKWSKTSNRINNFPEESGLRQHQTIKLRPSKPFFFIENY